MDIDVERIKLNYQKLPSKRLLAITFEPTKIREEVIPILQEELTLRGYEEEATKLSVYLTTITSAVSN